MTLSYLYKGYPYSWKDCLFLLKCGREANAMNSHNTPSRSGKTRGVYTVYMMNRKVSNISRTNSQNLNVSHLVLHLSFNNPLKPGVKSKMKM